MTDCTATNASATLAVNICTDNMLSQSYQTTQGDVKVEYMPAKNPQPELDLQQITKAEIRSQACSIAAFISICTCFCRKIIVNTF